METIALWLQEHNLGIQAMLYHVVNTKWHCDKICLVSLSMESLLRVGLGLTCQKKYLYLYDYRR